MNGKGDRNRVANYEAYRRNWPFRERGEVIKQPETTHEVICADATKWNPETKVDFVFIDPPFNIGQDYDGYSDSKDDIDYQITLWEFVYLGYRSLAKNGILAIHGPDEVCEYALSRSVTMCNKMRRIAWINWIYNFGQCRTSNWIDARCHCLLYVRNECKKFTWNYEDVLIESARVRYNDKRVANKNGKRVPGTIWGLPSDGPYWGRVNGNSKERRPHHPNQLPEVYLERLIRAYTNPGDTVLDPCAGSGTTAVVAKALGRNSISVDISESNCDSIRERLKIGAVRIPSKEKADGK